MIGYRFNEARGDIWWRMVAVVGAVCLGGEAVERNAYAEEDPSTTIVRVEEDWELVIRRVDSVGTAPHVTTIIAPDDTGESPQAVFELNHQTIPSDGVGGLHLHLVDDGTTSTYELGNNFCVGTSDEVVRWTQTMTLINGSLTFAVIQGRSLSWGSFAGGQSVADPGIATSLPNLNNYRPESSVNNSGVGLSAYRVESLTLKRVRKGTAAGTMTQDDTDRTVYQQD